MGKGSNTTTTNQSSSTTADPNAYANYLQLLQRAQGVASTPYQGYTGEETAPVNAQQTAGIGNINAISGVNSPFISQISASGQPISAADIQRYQDPYTNQVIQATQADFDTQNQRANSTVLGNAASAGALGGDRAGVAQALTQEAQARVQAPVIAGLRSSGYQQAVKTAEDQQQQQMRAGVAGQGAAQSAAGAQIGAGTLQQQTQQAQDTQARQDYYQQQGYPFQVAQWLAAIDTGVGGAMGSSSTGNAQTTGPSPNTFAQIAGLGLSAAGMFLNKGGRVPGVRGYAEGGGPWGNAQTWVPTPQLHATALHSQLPSAPQAAKQAGLSSDQLKGIGVLGKDMFGSNPSYGGGNWLGGDAYGGSSSSPLEGLSASDYGAGFYHGGPVRKRLASGGNSTMGLPWLDDAETGFYNPIPTTAGFGASQPAFEDRFSPAEEHPFGVLTRRPPVVDQDEDVVNPGDPIRLDPSADAAWQKRVDADNGTPQQLASRVGVPDNDNALTPGLGAPAVAAINRQIKPSGIAAEEEPETALGYAPRTAGVAPPPQAVPAEDKSGGFLSSLGIKMTPELKQGLLQAGLAMMATTRGGPGSFLGAVGEGGMAGVGAYSKSIEAEHKAQQEALENARKESDLNLRTTAQKETARHNKATEEIASDKAPSGYKRLDDGTLVFEKGGPHDPEVIAAETSARAKKGTELDDDTVDAIAQRVAQGDTRAVIGLGRNPAGIAQIQKRVAEIFKEQGLTHEEGAKQILSNIADQAGRMTSERTSAGIATKLAIYGRNVANAIGVAEKASEEANRTTFVPVNKAINAFKTQTGDPKIVALGQALTTLTNEYARAIGGGHGTVHDKEQAEQHLNQAQSHEQLKAIMNVMRQEVEMTKKSMPEAREEMHELYAPKGAVPKQEKMTSAPAATSPMDKQALDWANANPNDPRAAKIKQRLGVQ